MRLVSRLNKNAKIEVTLAPIPDKPFLTKEETAACLGITVSTLDDWVKGGVIPKPRKWGHRPARGKIFRRSYVDGLKDCIIIRNSTTVYYTLEEFGKLAKKRLLGLR